MRDNTSRLILRDTFCTCTAGLTENNVDWKGPLEVSSKPLRKAGPVRACCLRPPAVKLMSISKCGDYVASLACCSSV